jgi:hypothetical protein
MSSSTMDYNLSTSIGGAAGDSFDLAEFVSWDMLQVRSNSLIDLFSSTMVIFER